jgi:hypothetical protein
LFVFFKVILRDTTNDYFTDMQPKNQCLANAATLLACRSIAQSFAENIFELAHLRSGWNLEYAGNLKLSVEKLIEDQFTETIDHLQPDKLNAWRELMISALTDLAIVRASVKVDFRTDKAFVKNFFDELGYTQYFSEAKNGNHVSMYRFICEFAENLTAETKKKITGNGLDPNVVDRIVEDAKLIEQYKECFDMINDPDILESEGKGRLEEIYAEIQDICRITTAYYYFDPVKRESFNFFKALRIISV